MVYSNITYSLLSDKSEFAFLVRWLRLSHFLILEDTMIEEKKKIKATRLTWLCILLLIIIITIIIKALDFINIILLILPFCWCIILICFIGTFQLSCKKYTYKGNEIIVYAGTFLHYIKVNGIIVDKSIGFFNYIPVSLFFVLPDGAKIKVILLNTSRLALKINDAICEEENGK